MINALNTRNHECTSRDFRGHVVHSQTVRICAYMQLVMTTGFTSASFYLFLLLCNGIPLTGSNRPASKRQSFFITCEIIIVSNLVVLSVFKSLWSWREDNVAISRDEYRRSADNHEVSHKGLSNEFVVNQIS